VRRMIQFADDAKRAGARIHGDFAMGFPGETPEDAAATVELAVRVDPETAQFQLMIPFPGTPYHAEMVEAGWLNEQGMPDMPQFSNEQIRAAAKGAYRRFYLSMRHAMKCLRHPYDLVFSKFRTIWHAVPAMFWKRWDVE